MDVPYQIGALYSRATEIHDRYGGQRRGGISTPASSKVVIIFTGEAGKQHGYTDFWDEHGFFHYFGEGQSGDMRMVGGNRAILSHGADGKQLLLFQMMGKGLPYRYLGAFQFVDYYLKADVPDTSGALRTALVFRLEPLASWTSASELVGIADSPDMDLGSTTTTRIIDVRLKQDLFRRRLIGVEKGCRLTGTRDLRFLRASHIKPWARCASSNERTDGNNGLLLTPSADHLLDQGWMTFDLQGHLLLARDLPSDVRDRSGLPLVHGRHFGPFTARQQGYLEFHRNAVFEREYSKASDPHGVLIRELAKPATS